MDRRGIPPSPPIFNMDILAHGIWAGTAAKAINKKSNKPLSIFKTAFWGIFPDLFAFTITFVWLFWKLIFGDISFTDIPKPETGEPPAAFNQFPIFKLSLNLYNISHSAIVFMAVFGIIFIIFHRPIWELFGWLFHIIIDIPTHSYQFYPTPFLWPFSDWKFNGFSWGTPWFLILNYSAIIIVFWILRKKKFKPN